MAEYLTAKNKRWLAIIVLLLSIGILFGLTQLTSFSLAGLSLAFIVGLLEIYIVYIIYRNEI